MKLVVPSEILENEKRVGVTPDCVTSLIKMGFKVFVQSNAGINSSYSDDDYKKVIFLVIIMIFYGLTILRAGFFLSTSLFLIFSYYFLGERRWKYILIFSFPFVAIFMYLLHGVLAVYLRDPLLKYLGIMG